MLEQQFRDFLDGLGEFTDNGVTTRVNKAKKAEGYLEYSLDEAVSDDAKMYDTLIRLKAYDNPKTAPLQNAVRKYYIFKNGKEFPRLNRYRR